MMDAELFEIEQQQKAGLSAAKQARRQADLDAQLLANRIALLKQEEQKAWKKIQETKKRAGEIMALRARNEQKLKLEEELERRKAYELQKSRDLVNKQREKKRMEKHSLHESIYSQRKQSVAQCRSESRMLQQRKDMEREESVRKNVQKSSEIRTKELQLRQKAEEERRARLEKGRMEYEERVRQEEQERQRREALIAKMEREEMELIQKLQNTQMIQRSAYEELENALGTIAQPLRRSPRSAPSSQYRLTQ
eukprot:GILK01001061.1.p1 GENE.GILK01001061.1~~GILK01001061.1.p1  ORF type:complete len:252 (-),score=71.01 GILK01001061.1:936-1691(-)